MNVKLITDSSQMHSQFLQLKRCFDCSNIEIDGFLMLACLLTWLIACLNSNASNIVNMPVTVVHLNE